MAIGREVDLVIPTVSELEVRRERDVGTEGLPTAICMDVPAVARHGQRPADAEVAGRPRVGWKACAALRVRIRASSLGVLHAPVVAGLAPQGPALPRLQVLLHADVVRGEGGAVLPLPLFELEICVVETCAGFEVHPTDVSENLPAASGWRGSLATQPGIDARFFPSHLLDLVHGLVRGRLGRRHLFRRADAQRRALTVGARLSQDKR